MCDLHLPRADQARSMVSPRLTLLQFPDLRWYTFKRRETIPWRSDCLWKIETGVVRTLTWDEEGTVLTLGFWAAGDVVGQPLSRIHPYQIECLTTVKASVLSTANGCSQDFLIWHIQQTEELLKIISCKRIEYRLQQLLSWLARRFGREIAQGQLIDLRLTHQEIAEALSTTRVTVTRLLNQFEKEGIIGQSNRRWILLGKLEQH